MMEDNALNIEKAQRLSEFPLLFARAVVFGLQASKQRPAVLNSGTATLVDFGTGPMAITCAHVLEAYNLFCESHGRAFFKIGNVTLNPVEQVLCSNPRRDLATISLTQKQAAVLKEDGVAGASSIFEPRGWPPPPINEGDIVNMVGFPGRWRELVVFDELAFHGLCIGATRVLSVAEEQFVCHFERRRWVWAYQMGGLNDLQEQGVVELGGMSGGPVFGLRENESDLVGIISQFHSSLDRVILKPVYPIRSDGSIWGSALSCERDTKDSSEAGDYCSK